ncbi:translocation/assembly module TamB domain-containing protein, partial [Thermodesulfobacteriota bacterium]
KTPNAELSGECSFDLKGKQLNTKTHIMVPDLSAFSNTVNNKLEGALDLDLDIKGLYNDPEIIALGTGNNIIFRGIPINGPRFTLHTDNILSGPKGNLMIDLSLNDREFKASTDFTLNKNILTIKDLSLYGADSSINGDLVIDTNMTAIQGRIHGSSDDISLVSSLMGKRIMGSAIFDAEFSSDIETRQIDLTIQGNNLANDSIKAKEMSVIVQLKDYFSHSADPLAPLTITEKPKGQLEGDMHTLINGIQSKNPGFQNLPKASVSVNGLLKNNSLFTDVSLEGMSEKPVEMSFVLPVTASLIPLSFNFPRNEKIQGKGSAQLEIGNIPFLQSDDTVLKGSLLMNLSMTGLLEHPDFKGTLKIIDGHYENIQKGIVIKDIQTLTSLSGNRLNIDKVYAVDGENGYIEAKGWVDLLPLNNFPFFVETQVNSFALIQLDNMKITTGGQVVATGNIRETILSGDLKIDQAELLIPDRFASGVRELRVVEINKPLRDEIVVLKNTPESISKKGLDLSIEFPGKVFIRGRGLDSEWKGRLNIKGSTETPLINGNLSALRGSYSFLGKLFNIKSGSISFTGNSPPNPNFDVRCENTNQNMTAILHASGSTSAPKFTIESEPLLPSDEILSRLLFGKDMGSLTPFQAVKLAYALNTLRGKGISGIMELLDHSRKMLGIDQIEFKQSEYNNGETSISIGKYLRDNIYIEMEKGFTDDSGKVSVEVEVTPDISVESDIGMDSQGGLGINWKWDY